MVAKSLLALLLLVACTSVPRSEPRAAEINYWEALARLESAKAIAAARTRTERDFAEALHSLMLGDVEKAEHGFDSLRRHATDSVLRSGSRVMHIATLQYQEKWVELAHLARDTARPRATNPDRAAIELWALAFSNLPPPTAEFRARLETVPMSVSAVGTPLVPVQIGSQ